MTTPVQSTPGQALFGSITGRVSVTSGALPQVIVSYINTRNGLERGVRTDKTGNYAIRLLPNGVYAVTFRAEGFSEHMVRVTIDGKHSVCNARLSPNPKICEAACTLPPPGWKCTRGFHTDGPCAAIPDEDGPFDSNKRSKDKIIAGLERAVADALAGQVYGFFLDGPPAFMQGNEATEVCDIITADDLNRWFPKDGITLSKSEALILQKLVRGYVVGPSARAVLDKLNSVKE